MNKYSDHIFHLIHIFFCLTMFFHIMPYNIFHNLFLSFSFSNIVTFTSSFMNDNVFIIYFKLHLSIYIVP